MLREWVKGDEGPPKFASVLRIACAVWWKRYAEGVQRADTDDALQDLAWNCWRIYLRTERSGKLDNYDPVTLAGFALNDLRRGKGFRLRGRRGKVYFFTMGDGDKGVRDRYPRR